MEQKISPLVKEDDVSEVETKVPAWHAAGFATEEEYNALLKKIDDRLKTTELHPWVKEFAGIVNTGKEENTKTIFDTDVEEERYNTKKHFMRQEVELSKKDDVAEAKAGTPKWLLAGFKNEEEYNALLKKISDRLKTEKLNPLIAKISGIMSTGRNDTVESIFE